jgi:hypothetical protein
MERNSIVEKLVCCRYSECYWMTIELMIKVRQDKELLNLVYDIPLRIIELVVNRPSALTKDKELVGFDLMSNIKAMRTLRFISHLNIKPLLRDKRLASYEMFEILEKANPDTLYRLCASSSKYKRLSKLELENLLRTDSNFS